MTTHVVEQVPAQPRRGFGFPFRFPATNLHHGCRRAHASSTAGAGVTSSTQPTKEDDVVGWVIALCALAVVLIVAGIIGVRRHRRGSTESPPELAGTWEARHEASAEVTRLQTPPSVSGFPNPSP